MGEIGHQIPPSVLGRCHGAPVGFDMAPAAENADIGGIKGRTAAMQWPDVVTLQRPGLAAGRTPETGPLKRRLPHPLPACRRQPPMEP